MKEYKTVRSVSGPLITVVDVEGVSYDELVEVQVPGEQALRHGKVLTAQHDKAVIQMFEPTYGTRTEGTKVRFTGEVSTIGLSRSMLGRTFTGGGNIADGGPEITPEVKRSIEGDPINPWSREYPSDFIQTGISSIDVSNPLVRGQKLPVFSGSGMPHGKLAAQIARQANVTSGEEFAVVFATMGVTFEEADFFRQEFEETGAIERSVLFLNTASDPVIERISTPRLALTTAEYLAFDHNMHVLVILTDMTNYCEALREVSSARKEIPGRRGYPGYMYTDLAGLYERAGKIKGTEGTITQIPILSMPQDDKTHPIPDLTGYITEGQLLLSRALNQKGIYPPMDPQGSLSRLAGSDLADHTRDDHMKLRDQLAASYAAGLEARELAVVLGEGSLSDADRANLRFAEAYENQFIHQGEFENREVTESLDIGWKLLSMVPREELKRVKDDMIETYMPHQQTAFADANTKS